MSQNARLTAVQRKWLESLKSRDPELFAELQTKMAARVASRPLAEATTEAPGVVPTDIVTETIVREGRPALTITDNVIVAAGPEIEEAAKPIARRLLDAAAVINPIIPLIGRIDVANHPSNLPYVGTGWLVDTDIVATNRHVAELIARADGSDFRFRLDGFGNPLAVSLDYYHERASTKSAIAQVLRVIWIETDPTKADIAFIQVGRRSDGLTPGKIERADTNAAENSDVAVVGYPARAPSHIIPDQTRMDAVYGGVYDVKRIAPGLIGPDSEGWMTHDCTTLGGNSGSVVLDMRTGRAVGLHFAGLYLIENYAVPASVVREYLRTRPWQFEGKATPKSPSPSPAVATVQAVAKDAGGQVTFTVNLPVSFTVSLGKPDVTVGEPRKGSGKVAAAASTEALKAAAAQLSRRRVPGVLAVRPGYLIAAGELTDDDCLVVSATPARIAQVREAMPQSFEGFPVEIRPASLREQAAAAFPVFDEATVTSISYDDNARTGADFSFAIVEEPMKLLLHVGPERSWKVLGDFLSTAGSDLVSSMYEFHAEHIADAFDTPVNNNVDLSMVLATQSRNPKNGDIDEGDFDRLERFADWENKLTNFERVFVPLGSGGLVAMSYHIKVTVKDKKKVWLSSGNWKNSSQPNIPAADLNNPAKTSTAGNREWHVVIENDTLSKRFRSHILQDLKRSQTLGGTTEAVEPQIMVDVPIAALEAIELEAPATKVLEVLSIDRTVKVKPLLTPDKKGAVYSNAVLELIESAEHQLVFQIPYINALGATGFLDDLIEALIRKSQELDDFRMILRSDGFDAEEASELKRRGLDVKNKVKKLFKTHTKGMVVDGKRVMIGSHNWSSLGVTLNRDASLIFHDDEIAKYYLEAFEIDWKRAGKISLEAVVLESLAAVAPRLATGATPPPGFRRMTLDDYLEG
jgi:Trypsin-like peptidase domain/PLD-like domain